MLVEKWMNTGLLRDIPDKLLKQVAKCLHKQYLSNNKKEVTDQQKRVSIAFIAGYFRKYYKCIILNMDEFVGIPETLDGEAKWILDKIELEATK